MEEVVVTAQKRAENVQDIPATINAISGESLDEFNILQFEEVGALAPMPLDEEHLSLFFDSETLEAVLDRLELPPPAEIPDAAAVAEAVHDDVDAGVGEGSGGHDPAATASAAFRKEPAGNRDQDRQRRPWEYSRLRSAASFCIIPG